MFVQGRTRKLSGWVKRIIQPAREPNNANTVVSEKHFKNDLEANKAGLVEATKRVSDNDISAVNKETPKGKVLWDETPKRFKQRDVERERDDMETVDNVSITPLFSLCSSSVKSSTFSDAHSLQSTRATVLSGRTMDTNSSTMAIPPASILDRGRVSSGATTIPSSSSTSAPTSIHIPGSSSHRSRPNSLRPNYMQRDASSPTIDSVSTIK